MTPDLALQLAFGVTVLLVLWPQVGYLAALDVLDRTRRRRTRQVATPTSMTLPSVTVLVPVYNGRASIAMKIANFRALDYPADRLRLVIASDGSDDGTNEYVRALTDDRISLLAFPHRRGRALVTNDAIAQSESEWVLSTDVDTALDLAFLRMISPHTTDPSVGVVDGAISCINVESSSIARDVGVYWRMESYLKRLESDLGILASTFGNCTAFRRKLFRPLEPGDDVDFITPLEAIAQGYRVIHEPSAKVEDFAHETLGSQIRARERMVTKNFPGTLRMLPSIRSRPGVIAGLVSHKLLRWLTPFALILALILNAALAISHPLYRFVLALQLIFYAACLIGGIGLATSRRVPVASAAFNFVAANYGFLLGTLNIVRGVKMATYQPHAVRPKDVVI